MIYVYVNFIKTSIVNIGLLLKNFTRQKVFVIEYLIYLIFSPSNKIGVNVISKTHFIIKHHRARV